MIAVDDLGAQRSGGSQSVMGEGVEVAHQAAGGREEGLDGGLGEERAVQTGETKAVLEIEAGVVAVEPRQGVADGDSLGEGLEMGQAQLVRSPDCPARRRARRLWPSQSKLVSWGSRARRSGLR